MNLQRILIGAAIMAGITYLIRMLPLTLFQKKINNRFIKSFLDYMPYAVLSAMTFPDIFTSTASTTSALAGLAVATLLAWRGQSLVKVALSAMACVFAVEQILRWLGVLA